MTTGNWAGWIVVLTQMGIPSFCIHDYKNIIFLNILIFCVLYGIHSCISGVIHHIRNDGEMAFTVSGNILRIWAHESSLGLNLESPEGSAI